VESARRLEPNVDVVYGPATELMLDLADVRTDNRVLDVAAATRDQTLFSARPGAYPAGRGDTA
jgi:hypothetical protein